MCVEFEGLPFPQTIFHCWTDKLRLVTQKTKTTLEEEEAASTAVWQSWNSEQCGWRQNTLLPCLKERHSHTGVWHTQGRREGKCTVIFSLKTPLKATLFTLFHGINLHSLLFCRSPRRDLLINDTLEHSLHTGTSILNRLHRN